MEDIRYVKCPVHPEEHLHLDTLGAEGYCVKCGTWHVVDATIHPYHYGAM